MVKMVYTLPTLINRETLSGWYILTVPLCWQTYKDGLILLVILLNFLNKVAWATFPGDFDLWEHLEVIVYGLIMDEIESDFNWLVWTTFDQSKVRKGRLKRLSNWERASEEVVTGPEHQYISLVTSKQSRRRHRSNHEEVFMQVLFGLFVNLFSTRCHIKQLQKI